VEIIEEWAADEKSRGEFDVFLTSDQSIPFQQSLQGFKIAVVVLSTNNLRRLAAQSSQIQAALLSAVQGEVRRLEIP
jgi:hypothetical protein